MEEDSLLTKIQGLSDLEIATLLCLVSQEHCIIDTEPEALDDLVNELKLVAANILGLSYSVVDCSSHMSLDEFAAAILLDSESPRAETSDRARHESYSSSKSRLGSASSPPLADGLEKSTKIPNVIIAKNLANASKQVQIQALELIRTRRIYTHTSVETAPRDFLFISLVPGGVVGPKLTKHLNEHIYISHYHDPEEHGYPNMEEAEDDGDSISSVRRRRTVVDPQGKAALDPLLLQSDFELLRSRTSKVTIQAEVTQYLHNIIAFLRMHRAVWGGISALATRHFNKLVKSLAPLHGLDYVTPSLVTLAAKKIYPHRIQIVEPRRERSMQWGSEIEAVTAALEGVDPQYVIEDVLGMVEVPL